MQYTPTHIKTQNFVESIIKRQYVDPPINIRRIPPAIDGWSNYTEAGATGGLSNLSQHIPAIDGPSEALSQSSTEETTTIDPNLSQSINNTQQNQKSPKKEGKSKTVIEKLYNMPKSFVGGVKEQLGKLYNSETFQHLKDVAVDKLGKAAKSILGSETVKNIKTQAIEKGKHLTKNFGTALINRGASILVGSAAAAAVGK